MTLVSRTIAFTALLLTIAACNPSDRRPGLSLTGEHANPPADWSFTDQIPEIAIQVHTPYLLPHSVTIWCSSVDGKLYIGASRPETKRWPGWVDANPEVKLRIDGKLYDAKLTPLTDADELAKVRSAFAAKYKLQPPADGSPPPSSRQWAVEFEDSSS